MLNSFLSKPVKKKGWFNKTVMGRRNKRLQVLLCVAIIVCIFQIFNSKWNIFNIGKHLFQSRTTKAELKSFTNDIALNRMMDKFRFYCQRRGIFLYEYLQRFNQLDEKKLPPHSAFYSNLQQKNISEEDYQFYVDILAGTEHDLFKRPFRVV
uniref:Uncharacterized protein n=1 Tax=Magallana gigas TaxID=29159 RepID=A0A8W8MIH4_MAGGI